MKTYINLKDSDFDYDRDLKTSAGDYVTIGEDKFYYIGKDENGNALLLPEYNINGVNLDSVLDHSKETK